MILPGNSNTMSSTPTRPNVPRHGGLWNTLIYILLLPVYLIGSVFPRDKNLFAFGSGHGHNFIDNSKYLFLWCSKNLTGKTCLFFSKNPETVTMLINSGYNAVYTYSLKGLLYAMRAKQCYISHSAHDIHGLLIGGAEIIQLWHGTPLKKISYDVLPTEAGSLEKMKHLVRKVLFTIVPYLSTSTRFSKLIISSEYVRESFKTAFRKTNNDILILGQARNDTMAGGFHFDKSVFPEITYLDQLKRESNHVITWMPTHRMKSGGGIGNLLNGYSFDRVKFEQLLQEHNTRLVVKVHFLDSSMVANFFKDSDRIIVYKYADPYPLLTYTDILITDYSSVYFDFLLMDRPIVFAPFDKDDYIRDEASFYYNYDEVTPGEKCYDWDEVVRVLRNHLKHFSDGTLDPFATKRKEVCDLFNDYKGNNAARILDIFIRGVKE